ncbi:NarK family nitrate/nitrite MFS transporter [Entomomonas moraniae]|uniref:Nitrate/nitrite transporter n=1 Tax=Entomomonas moraniae TaxID=2213226 RepID=A0A3S9XDG5_9GAMM|nr:NarK family nitrate/nitrite MFS transporter [Entomomonas moraniae]AZS50473.1 NarK family nitrate/nitrite MFS transporter [Entomomonas moraniae]
MSKLLKEWTPEDPKFWKEQGRSIARRNLWISIPGLLLAFVVWQLWSVVVVYLPRVGFNYTPNELMWLTALPALSGATLRIFYSFMVPIFGGRRWTAISTATLLIPTIGLGICIQDPTTSFTTMAILALLCGFGGANFSSSMANIGYFFPKAEKGSATGLNAGLGNLGVSAVQFIVPLVVGVGIFGALGGLPQTWTHDNQTTSLWLQNAGYIWVPFIALVVVFAWFGMNDIASAKASLSDQFTIFKRKHNWIMCWLYVGTFGSFIGFSAALPLLIKHEFPTVNPLTYAFIGPLLGSIFRVLGGILSDKIGGARVTQWSFVAMILCVFSILYFLPEKGQGGSFAGFLISFLVLFVFVGLGNGSTFAQVPNIFIQFHKRIAKGKDEEAQKHAMLNANKESGAVLGFIGAIGGYGGFIVPRINGISIDLTGSITLAFYYFIAFYITCVLVNWWFYARKNAEAPC